MDLVVHVEEDQLDDDDDDELMEMMDDQDNDVNHHLVKLEVQQVNDDHRDKEYAWVVDKNY